MHLPVSPNSFGFNRFLASLAPLCILFLTPAGWTQEKPASKPAAPRKQVRRPPAPSGHAEAVKDPVEEHYRAAETFQLAGDLVQAEAEYRRVITLALQRLAALRILSQDERQALVFLQSATAADPSDVEAQLSLASVYFRLGDLTSAKTILRSVHAKDEHRLPAKSLLGNILFMEGDYPAAADQLQAVMEEGSDLSAAYSLALTYLKLNNLTKATGVFDEMLASMGSSAELHVLIGRAYREGDQFDLAAGEFRKALALKPDVARAHAYLGIVYLLQRGDSGLAEARSEFEAELLRNPGDYSSHYNLGVIHFKQHTIALAEQELAKAIQLLPDSPDAYFYLGQARLQEGKSREAVPQLEKAILLYGSASKAAQPAHDALSKAFENLGRHVEAQRESETARELGRLEGETQANGLPAKSSSVNEIRSMLLPSNPGASTPAVPPQYLAGLHEALGNAYHNLGVILAQRSAYPEAARLFAEAAKWSPGIKTLDRNQGVASFRANQYEMAVDPLQRHVHANPEDSSARQMLGLSYFMTKDYRKAAEAFRPILAALPDNPSLLYAAGASLAKSGDSAGASEIFRRMLVQNPDAAEVHLFLAQAHAQNKEDDEALTEFSRSLVLNPKLPEANYGQGMIHLRQGKLEQAEADFRAELAANPGDPSAEYRLGHVLLLQHKQAEAIELLSDVVRQKPNDADPYYELGKALLEKGDLKTATERLETAVRLGTQQPYAYYQLSLAYQRQGRAQDAETTLRQYERLRQKKAPVPSESDTEKPN
jgi:tetratricopeptide (TPR) repeat protein